MIFNICLQQVAGIIRFISNLTDAQPQLFGQGYHLLCHSQGALLCRCIAQEWDNHNVSSLVSIAGPHVPPPPTSPTGSKLARLRWQR